MSLFLEGKGKFAIVSLTCWSSPYWLKSCFKSDNFGPIRTFISKVCKYANQPSDTPSWNTDYASATVLSAILDVSHYQ